MQSITYSVKMKDIARDGTIAKYLKQLSNGIVRKIHLSVVPNNLKTEILLT